MAMDVIKPMDREFSDIPQATLGDSRYMPHFKDCIGAIDGVHVQASIPHQDQVPYMGRKGMPTQKVMAVCNFDMQFIFAYAGWEGTAHDTRVFLSVLRNENLNFPKPPSGKYYLVDAGSVIERTFGVWKKRWKILRDMPNYPFNKQLKIVIATMTLHNYIRRHAQRDRHFDASNDILSEEIGEDVDVQQELHSLHDNGTQEMEALRNSIATSLMNASN
ncbi:hypothetical protein L3X38_010031 [Prunus dulcis]|uniref:DDE Tnp4 domain-containing protein n=1 Tax=Prunus dulcis TaxID=3755 RepID=A0AAD4ZE20_PRUDU|nr:hypothetical protein L3X38_010031 [Prunus dulcis]